MTVVNSNSLEGSMWHTSYVFLGAFAKFGKATISFVVSVRPSVWNNSALTGRIFMGFVIWVFLENMLRIFRFHQNLTRAKGVLYEDRYTLMIISRWIFLTMKNDSDKVVEKIETHILCSITFFPRKSCPLWNKVGKFCTAGQATDKNIIGDITLHAG